MLPNFLVEETTVRDSGESAVFDIGQDSRQSIVLTLGITHAVEQQHIQLQILGSAGRPDVGTPSAGCIST